MPMNIFEAVNFFHFGYVDMVYFYIYLKLIFAPEKSFLV